MEHEEAPDPRDEDDTLDGEQDSMVDSAGGFTPSRKMSTPYQKIDNPPVPENQLPLFRVSWGGEGER